MIIGLFVFVLYLYLFVGFNKIFLVVRDVNIANYFTFYLLALGTVLFVMFCWVSSWRGLLKTLGVEINLKNAYFYYFAGYFVDLIVPCQQICGELTRLYLVRNETKHNYGVIGAAGIANRILGYSIVTSGLSVGVVYLLVSNRIPTFATDLLVLTWFGALVYLSVLLYLALSENAADKLASIVLRLLKVLRVKRYRSQNVLSPGLVASLRSFHEGFALFRGRPRHLVAPIIFQSIAYSLSLLSYILVFYSLGFTNLIFDFFIIVYFLAGAIQDFASVFSVGGLEILLTNLFVFFGIGQATSGVAAAVLRSVTFWFPLIVGFVIVQVIGARSLLNPDIRKDVETEVNKKIFKKEDTAESADVSQQTSPQPPQT